MDDIRDLFDQIFEAMGIPSIQTIIDARAFVNHTFPDLRSRQAFLGTMVSSMCEEFDVDMNSLFDIWKEVL